MKSKVTFFILSIYGGALAFLIFNSVGGDSAGNDAKNITTEIPTIFTFILGNF